MRVSAVALKEWKERWATKIFFHMERLVFVIVVAAIAMRWVSRLRD
jgi:hypothetical protein